MVFRYGKRDLLDSEELVAIGDIHGNDSNLEDILIQIAPLLDLNSKCHAVFCGDVCDRGPNSARVFDLLINFKRKYPTQSFFIMGNHEEMLIATLKGDLGWLAYTQSTWDSMSEHWQKPLVTVEELALECLKRGVIDFLDNLIPYYESKKYICTHAPLDRATCYMHGLKSYKASFGKKIIQNYLLEDLGRSIRWDFTLEDPRLCAIPELVKHHIAGHQYQHHRQPRIMKHRSFIDVGCGKYHKPLVAVHFPRKKIYRSFSKPL